MTQAYNVLKDLHGRALDADAFMRATLAQVMIIMMMMTVMIMMMIITMNHDDDNNNDGKTPSLQLVMDATS